MFRGIHRQLLLSVWMLAMLVGPATICSGKYSGGTGDPNTPYQIANATDLLTLAADVNDYNKCFILTADINLDPNLPGGQVFTTAIIAADTNSSVGFQGTTFTGTFDGNDHKITHFTINGGSNRYLGLFGIINSVSSIKNLGLENFTVSSEPNSQYVGGLAGVNAGSISNCYSTGMVSGSCYVGDLVGFSANGSINNCYSTGAVSGSSGSWCLGGLVGVNYSSSTISNCYSTSEVSGASYIGGLEGSKDGSISNCYSTGAVSGSSGSSLLGGLVGYNEGNIRDSNSTGAVSGTAIIGGLVGDNYFHGTISNCYSTGSVSGSSYVGGLAGNNYGTISNCDSTGSVSGSSRVGGLVGYNYTNGIISSSYFLDVAGPNNGAGIPLTDTQMKQQSNFSGWDFTTIWAICEGTNYPRLRWQIPAADFVCPDGVNFVDYSFFAARWLETNCAVNDDCNGSDFDLSGAVDWPDLMAFARHWLEGVAQ
jgi:hypothetical protein